MSALAWFIFAAFCSLVAFIAGYLSGLDSESNNDWKD